MNWRFIRTVYLKELKDSLRDRRTLVSMIVIPTLVMPVLVFSVGLVMQKVIRQVETERPRVMVIGGADSPEVAKALQAENKFEVVPTAENYRELITDKKLAAAVEIPAGFDAALQAGAPRAVTLYHFEGEIKSGKGRQVLKDFFERYHEKILLRRLTDRQLPADFVNPFSIKSENVAPPKKVNGNAFGGLVPYMIIILCFTGAMYPAIDLTAGEKERGTMETLLCSPVPRLNLVLGKFLMVLTASVTTMLLSLVSMGVSVTLGVSMFAARGAGTAGQGGGSALPTIDLLGLAGVFTMIVPVAVFFAAVQLAIALMAKSFKEAQSYVSPLLIIVIMPAVIGILPGIELNAKTALIPILNLSLVCKELLSGVWHWNYLALIFGSTAVYDALALGLCVWMFNREDVIFRA